MLNPFCLLKADVVIVTSSAQNSTVPLHVQIATRLFMPRIRLRLIAIKTLIKECQRLIANLTMLIANLTMLIANLTMLIAINTLIKECQRLIANLTMHFAKNAVDLEFPIVCWQPRCKPSS